MPSSACCVINLITFTSQVCWHDLAFFDPVLYESLRQLVADAEAGSDDVIETLDLTFMVDLQPEEGGGQVCAVMSLGLWYFLIIL